MSSSRARLPAGARRAGRIAIHVGAAGALLLLLGVGIGPQTGRYRTLTVLSGSMHPAFETGDVVVAIPERRQDVRVGQVIVYNPPDGSVPVSHRIVWLQRDDAGLLVRTRGDANNSEDPWTAQLTTRSVWRVWFAVPKLGYVLSWLQGIRRHLLVLMFATALISIGTVAYSQYRRSSRARPPDGAH